MQPQRAKKYVKSSEVVQKVNNKPTLFDACVRNRYVMPLLKDSITTYAFLEAVRD